MEWLIVWIACGVFAAAVAASKGRSFVGWLFLGIFFGIFALLAVGFMPKVEDAVAMPGSIQSTEREERKCPFCAEMIKAEAIVCKHCGRDVEPITPTEAIDAQEDKTEQSQLQEYHDIDDTKKENESNIKYIFLFICVVLFISVVLFYSSKNEKSGNNAESTPKPAESSQKTISQTYEMPSNDEQKEALEIKAKNGDKKAILTLAYALAYSENANERERGYGLFKALADDGNEYAQYELGRALYSGAGVKQDKEKGLEYLNMAASKGHKQSREFFTDLKGIK